MEIILYNKIIRQHHIYELKTISGNLPKRIKAAILEWVDENRDHLLDNWKRAQNHLPMIKIKPLE